MNILLICPDAYLAQKEIEKIRQDTLEAQDGMNEHAYDWETDSLEQILADADQVPFLSARKLILVGHADLNAADDGKAGLSQEEAERLERYLENPAEFTTIVWDCSGNPPDGRTAFGKRIQKLCRTIRVQPLDADGFFRKVSADLQDDGIRMGSEAKRELMDRLSGDLEEWENVREILRNYPGQITADAVSQLVSRSLFGSGEKDRFLFVDAILSHDMKRSMAFWQDLKAQVKSSSDYFAFIGLLASQVRFLYRVKYLSSRGCAAQRIAEQTDANPYRVKITLQKAGQYGLEELSSLLNDLAELDEGIKSGAADPALGFELFLIQTTRGKKLWSH